MRPREITFAEQELNIHGLWEDLQVTQGQVEIYLGRKTQMLGIIRDAELAMNEREQNIINRLMEDKDSLPSMAAVDRAIKQAVGSDDELSRMRADLVSKKNMFDEIEGELRAHELKHRTLIARMGQVSDYMRFLTSARDARTVAEKALPY